jgi:hypothetical protein
MSKQELARLRFQLVSAVTEYDHKQSTKQSYNMYALPQYLARVDEIISDIEAGADPRSAIAAGFTDRLLAAVMRKLKMTSPTREEIQGIGSVVYTPVAKRNPMNRFDKTAKRYHSGDDPSRQEMIEHIKGVYGREADRFDIEEAIYWFANDYHGGQGSNLYSALSTSEYRPGQMSSGPEEGSMSEMIYADLVDTFAPTKRNPLKRRKGETQREFMSRCMSEETRSPSRSRSSVWPCASPRPALAATPSTTPDLTNETSTPSPPQHPQRHPVRGLDRGRDACHCRSVWRPHEGRLPGRAGTHRSQPCRGEDQSRHRGRDRGVLGAAVEVIHRHRSRG